MKKEEQNMNKDFDEIPGINDVLILGPARELKKLISTIVAKFKNSKVH